MSDSTNPLPPLPPPSAALSEPAIAFGAVRRRRVAPFIVLAVTLVFAGLFVLLAGSDTQRNTLDLRTPLLAKEAPAIIGESLSGEQFDLASLRGRIVVLNFFQSTCQPCIAEHPALVQFATQQASMPDGAQLVSVVFNDRRDAVARFFEERGGGDWPVVLERGVSVPYGVAKVPETWIIDKQGKVAARIISEVTLLCLSAKVDEVRTGVPFNREFCA